MLLSLSLALSHPHTRAADNSDSAPPPLPVTVTPEMGDVGGKFFGKVPDPQKVHHYYIAAEPELWNFVPEGQDPVCGKAFPSSLLLNRVSWKIRYIQYADPQFSARVLPTERLGILGPVLRGTTGEYLAVTVLNRSWRPISMHPHGAHYDKDSEGSFYKPNPGLGAAIAPGARFTYIWHLDEASGPRPDEPSSKAWLYHSHVAGDEDINLGMFGFLIVTDPKRARPDGTPKDVDREMAAVFNIFDESNLPDSDNDEPDERPAKAPTGPTGPIQRTWSEIQQFTEEGERHAINGRTFGNLAGLEMNQGEHVRWYLFGLGSEKDFHTAHWHGERVVEDGRRRTDVVELLPASMKIADMQADNPGSWLFHCHVADHMESGMYAKFVVYPSDVTGASRDPRAAFFGMPEAAQTLHFQSAELTLPPSDANTCELNVSGQVTVPDPYPSAGRSFTVELGSQKITFHPDASGISVGDGGMLVVKNGSLYGNGVVTGGTLHFDLTLKGNAVRRELEKARVIEDGQLASKPMLHLNLVVGDAHHTGAADVKLLPP
ncbi:multicopper oxidase domain-containing protein [Chthoniobacter flavus]|nr:multicopper oxidase domain-containing protein [Chthoniobacter flavus]